MAEVKVARADHVGIVSLSNPGKLNAMTKSMWDRFPAALRELDGDDGVRVILVRGEGSEAFVSGADFSEFRDLRSSAQASTAYSQAVEAAALAPSTCRKPVVASIQGHCIGGGLALAAGCDIRLAAENASFRIPAVKLGTGYPVSSLRNFMHSLGAQRTLDIFLSSRKFDAHEALAMGFVAHVGGAATMDAFAKDYCDRIAEGSPLAVRAIKAGIRQLMVDEADRDKDAVAAMIRACFESADHAEGRRAIAEKRKPRFTGH